MATKPASRDAHTAVRPGRRRTARAVLFRRHGLFALLLTAGLALRTVVFLAYEPALFSPDSRFYLEDSSRFEPPTRWPIGYPAFLRLLPFELDLAVIPLVQHLLGLVIAGLLYVLLLRLDVQRWLAALACAPVLLDAYQLNIEEYVLSETAFELLLTAAAAALLWWRPLGRWAACLAGVLLAAAALTRTVGIVAVPFALAAVFFLTSGMTLRARLLRVASFLAAFVVVLGAYVGWLHSVHGTYSLAGSAGRRLYGRVAPWVDCSRISVPRYEHPLCPAQPVGERPRVFTLVWSRRSPVNDVQPPPGMTRSRVAGDFARRVILQEPLAYGRAVASDFVHIFAPTKEPRPGGYRLSQWQFQVAFPIPGYPPTWSPSPPAGFGGEGSSGHVRRSLASFLRTYQRFGYTPGPLLAAALLAGVAAAVGAGRARRSGLRSAAFLFSGIALAISLGTLAVVPFSWRHQLPLFVLLPPAGALGIRALTGGTGGGAEARR